ncbi:3-hydroxyacyl-CoA dehydrogenase NAD-binding domain-containing protein [Gammaproteobacteria bacterium]|nr:3-hydroxyacyl-CoA dehydrogenase NAD-binding domain-containing protein [Gammaproteobacteria bacterium]
MNITYCVKKNIALIGINIEDQSVNTLGPSVFQALKKAIQTANDTDEIHGLIIHSDKDDFCYGADIAYIQKLAKKTHELQYKTLRGLHQIFNLLENGKPSVCIVQGQCLGGGLELALATQHRIAIQDSNLRMGLPESKIGIIPGLGGTQRLPRLIGLEPALSMLLKGNSVNITQAQQMGLIDHSSINKKYAISEAIQWLQRPQALPKKDITPFKQVPILSAAIALTKKTSQDCYPHLESLLQAVYEGGLVSLDNALEIEIHLFIKVLNDEQTTRMLQTLFTDRTKLKRRAKAHHQTYPIQHLGIIGGGFMGSAIAAHALSKNIQVTIVEQQSQIQACSLRVKNLLSSYPQSNERKLKVSKSNHAISQCDVVIEAVFEDIALKKSVLQDIDPYLKPGAILASNTSSIAISELAKVLKNPQQFVGIHFFSPVSKMPLVEIIKGKKTSQKSMSIAQSLTYHLQKVPICIKDTPGFYTTNIAMAYAQAALKLLDQGVAPYIIERAARRIGMPTPPLKLMDEIGIDVIYGIIQSQQQLRKQQLKHLTHIENLYHQKRLGRKVNAGFYDYSHQQPVLWKGLSHHTELSSGINIEDVESVLYKQQTAIANQLVKSGVIDKTNANVGAILGLGFCPWSGGPIR